MGLEYCRVEFARIRADRPAQQSTAVSEWQRTCTLSALAARLQTNSDSQVANTPGNLWASEPWLFLFGFGRLGPSARRQSTASRTH